MSQNGYKQKYLLLDLSCSFYVYVDRGALRGMCIEVACEVAKIWNIVQQNHTTVKNNDNNILLDTKDLKVMILALKCTTNE